MSSMTARQARLERRARNKFPSSRREAITAYLFSAPFMLLFLVFTVTPVVMSLAIGFTDFNQLQPPSFVGLDNYIRLFLEDSIFIKAACNTLFWR